MKRIIVGSLALLTCMSLSAVNNSPEQPSFIKSVSETAVKVYSFSYAPWTTAALVVAHEVYKNYPTQKGGGDGSSGSGNGGGSVGGWKK